jgi:hypothetical protein
MINKKLTKYNVYVIIGLFFVASITTNLYTQTVDAEENNLLINPGFEANLFAWDYTIDYCTWSISDDANSGLSSVKAVEQYD